MTRVVLLRGSIVESIAVCEDVESMRGAWAEIGLVAVALDAEIRVAVGDVYDGQAFTSPPPSPEAIAAAKAVKLAAIRARTEELRAIGFEYTDTRPNGARFTSRYSLEHDALGQIERAKGWAKDDIRDGTSNCPIPLPWANVDRTGFAYLGSTAAVVDFARASALADYALTSAGAGLEMTLKMATTLEDIEAVRDAR